MDPNDKPAVAICVVKKVYFKVLNHLLVQHSVMRNKYVQTLS